jgi:thymidylate synthase ThyX
MKVELIEKPTEADWLEVKRRALVTIGKKPLTPPDTDWKHKILRARHSPIRRLHFSFYIECPYWVSVHLCRHIHAQPYVKSQRNDRQDEYDRNSAPQDAMVSMIWDMNAEELMTIANKRLCKLTAEETREVVVVMCDLVKKELPEFVGLLTPYCAYWGRCQEMYPCYEKEGVEE